MNAEEKRKIENQLMVMGLRQLSDPEMVIQMARIINAHPGYTDPHAFYMGLLGECDPQQRNDMYEALRPHLKFAPWPLDRYEALLAEPTAHVQSSERPVLINGKEYAEVPAADSEWCFLTLTCHKCTRSEEFGGFTLVAAMQVARTDGWVRDVLKQKEVCPKCSGIGPTRNERQSRGIPLTPDDQLRLAKAEEKRRRKASRC
jgi:hypothetical protein